MLLGDLLQAASDAEQDYAECAARHDGLIEWVRAALKRFGG